ncbi:MAG: hypothetical protein ACRCXL_13820 [Dermatophilaceae bacterium]
MRAAAQDPAELVMQRLSNRPPGDATDHHAPWEWPVASRPLELGEGGSARDDGTYGLSLSSSRR